MARARCILCGTELIGETCPKCLPGDSGDGRIDRDTDKARPSVRRKPSPAPSLPLPTKEAPAARVSDDEGDTEKVAPLAMGSRDRATSLESPVAKLRAGLPPREAEEERAAPAGPAPSPKAESADDQKARWYAMAGVKRPQGTAPQPTEADLPAPISSREDEHRGFVPAAILCAAQGVANLLALGFGHGVNLTDTVLLFLSAGALLKEMGAARFLLLASMALHVGLSVMGLVLTGSGASMLAALPAGCVLGAFLFESPKWRAGACGVGVALAFSWLGAVALGGGAKPQVEDVLAPFAVEGNRLVDEAAGLTIAAPEGTVLYDGKKITEAIAKGVKGTNKGLLGMFAKERDPLIPGERAFVRGTAVAMDGMVRMGTLPPQVATADALATLFGKRTRAVRDDALVPGALRDAEGLTTEGWQQGPMLVVVARAADGRMLTATCDASGLGGDKACRTFFEGLRLKPTLSRAAPAPN